MERNDHLIRKKIYKYMFTSVLTTVALQLGNVVDAMIVGNLIGSSANAAVCAGTPFVYLLQVAAFLMGMGGAVTIAVLLGERDTDNAGRVMGVSLLASFVYPLIFTFLTPVTVPAYIHLLGLSGEQAEMVRQIITVYSLGMPVCSVVIAMTNMISVDNHPTLSSAMLITANVINLTCDVLLVKFTPLGLIGSTLSTIIGYAIGGLIFIPVYLKSKDRMVKPSLKGEPVTYGQAVVSNKKPTSKLAVFRSLPSLMQGHYSYHAGACQSACSKCECFWACHRPHICPRSHIHSNP
ncbi:MAG: hypothetical protein IJ080_06130 [Oscillospiraceae bacterium]|nr:hypothetical protein [Oscillospiraceae bacterium]